MKILLNLSNDEGVGGCSAGVAGSYATAAASFTCSSPGVIHIQLPILQRQQQQEGHVGVMRQQGRHSLRSWRAPGTVLSYLPQATEIGGMEGVINERKGMMMLVFLPPPYLQ